MTESAKNEYFIDGFMIKHFDVYPIGFDKNNLFEEQKIFLIYLLGSIPSVESWSTQVDYKLKREETLSNKKVELSKTEMDVAKLQGKNIEELKKERLRQEKNKNLKQLNEDFGIKEEIKEEEIEIEGVTDLNKDELIDKRDNQEKLWDMLNGKNLIKK